MNTNIIFKKTVDLTPQQREQMRRLFFTVFGREMTEKMYERRFMCSSSGYSYHGLLTHEDKIVGSFNAIPYRYLCYGQQRLFALSVDTMISPQHRGGKATLTTMANLVYDALVKDGVYFIYGFPNELYYAHEKRILGTLDIGKLNYYVLPINVGTAMRRFRGLNYASRFFARITAGIPGSRNAIAHKYDIEKINDEQFIKHRYDDSYSLLSLNNGANCLYKIYKEEEGVEALHLLDIWPMTPVAMDEAVLKLLRQYFGYVDLIIYVGRLAFRPRRLIKVPQWLEPQKIRMTGKILVEGKIPDSIFDINNWNVNVSNFDVR